MNCTLILGKGTIKTENADILYLDENYQLILPNDKSLFWNVTPYVFIHIPRTAGFSVSKKLYPGCYFGWHPADYFPRHVWKKLTTIVRNPYDRAVSAYFFLRQGGFFGNETRYSLMMKKYTNFEQWVINGLDSKMLYVDNQSSDGEDKRIPHLIMQTEWILPHDKRKLGKNPDFKLKVEDLLINSEWLVKYENLAADCQKLYNIKDLSRCHSSVHGSWPTYYQNQIVRRIIYSFYQRDFELLGYSEEIKLY